MLQIEIGNGLNQKLRNFFNSVSRHEPSSNSNIAKKKNSFLWTGIQVLNSFNKHMNDLLSILKLLF